MNKCNVNGIPFRSEEPITKRSSEKRRHGQMRTPADGGGGVKELADVRELALFIVITVVCFADALYQSINQSISLYYYHILYI